MPLPLTGACPALYRGKTPGFARGRQHRINGFVLFKVLYCNVLKSNINCINVAVSVHICYADKTGLLYEYRTITSDARSTQ